MNLFELISLYTTNGYFVDLEFYVDGKIRCSLCHKTWITSDYVRSVPLPQIECSSIEQVVDWLERMKK